MVDFVALDLVDFFDFVDLVGSVDFGDLAAFALERAAAAANTISSHDGVHEPADLLRCPDSDRCRQRNTPQPKYSGADHRRWSSRLRGTLRNAIALRDILFVAATGSTRGRAPDDPAPDGPATDEPATDGPAEADLAVADPATVDSVAFGGLVFFLVFD